MEVKMSFLEESQLPKLEYSESNLVDNDDGGKRKINDYFIPEKVFLSNIDSYHGRHIAAAIAQIKSQKEGDDVDEIESLEESSAENADEVQNTLKYEIIGSISAKDFLLPNHVEEIIDVNEKSKILEKILSCKFIIYDISEDPSQVEEAAWAIKALDEEFSKRISTGNEIKKTVKPINYILISNVLTWAKTKPIDPDEPDEPITEDSYRLRKPHPNYKLHFDLEKDVIQIGKKHKKVLKTIVVAAGLVYGLEENLMKIFFKLAWMNEPCPYFLPGNNTVPLLHINDLASIISNLMESMPKKRWCIIAIEETAPPSKEIVKAISKELGAGKVAGFPKEEVSSMKEMNTELYDYMTVDLNMSPKYILDNMDLKHVPDDKEMNFLNIMKETVSQFIEIHGLKVIKIYINGPPLSGKTFLSKKLCSYYQLHYLSYDTIMDDFCNRMNSMKNDSSKIKRKEDNENVSEYEEENADEDTDYDEKEEDLVSEEEDVNELLEIFEQLEEAKLNNSIPDQEIINTIIKEKLLSKSCQNQGYVLDGYPETYDQAKKLFCINGEENEKDEEEEEGEEDDDAPLPFVVDKRIMPDHIFDLIADDAILLYRGKNIPPEREMDDYYNEESLKKSIIDYRLRNSDVLTVMNFFLEVDYYPIDISVNNDERPLLQKAFRKLVNLVGKPCKFGSEENKDEKLSEEEAALILLQNEELLQEKLKKEYEDKLKRRAMLEEWVITMSVVKKEEEDSLQARTEPIRNYILREIFPHLKEALMEIYKVKPKDPVTYLAEYLFTHHVDGKHFPPESNEFNEDNVWACLGMVKDK